MFVGVASGRVVMLLESVQKFIPLSSPDLNWSCKDSEMYLSGLGTENEGPFPGIAKAKPHVWGPSISSPLGSEAQGLPVHLQTKTMAMA